MGKHETIKSTTRVQKHRAEMKAKGFRLRQIWVPDMRDPKVRERLLWESKVIAARERANPEECAWLDVAAARAWNDLPD